MTMMKKNALGKGLDSLIPNKINVQPKHRMEEQEKKEVFFLNINQVEPNREQPRKNFNEDALQELSDSIRQFGVLQPLLVEKKADYYEIIAGERRWRAARMAGIKELPVIMKNLTEQERLEISLIENIQRENLNPIEEAMAYKRLMKEFNLKQDEIADRVAKSRTAVTNAMRLLKLDERVQQMVIDDMISTGHARTLLAIHDLEKQFILAQKVFDEKLSVRETEKLVKKILKEEKEGGTKAKNIENKSDSMDAVYQDVQEQMKSILGTKVTIQRKNKDKGKIEIEYYSSDELNRIFELFRSIQE